MLENTKIDVAKIRLDGGTQSREKIHADVVEDYAEAMKSGTEFPAIVVFFDGSEYWLGDGFHRASAAVVVGVTEIAADVHQGTRRDAVLYSVGANAQHGLQRTNADKRRAVLTLLHDFEWSGWSNYEIARRCSVSDFLVRSLRENRSEEGAASRTFTDKHGNTSTMSVGNIGKKVTEGVATPRADDIPPWEDDAPLDPASIDTSPSLPESAYTAKKVDAPSSQAICTSLSLLLRWIQAAGEFDVAPIKEHIASIEVDTLDTLIDALTRIRDQMK